jgi:superfamily II helicase|tara:strand:- start:23 stop:325 length:303 start_codon:yes stop_codon:yes gene_type:complete
VTKDPSDNSTKSVLLRVLSGTGTHIDKIDVVSNLVAEKLAMTERMADLCDLGNFVSANTILNHLLSLDKVLSTVTVMETPETDPDVTDYSVHPGDCIGKN